LIALPTQVADDLVEPIRSPRTVASPTGMSAGRSSRMCLPFAASSWSFEHGADYRGQIHGMPLDPSLPATIRDKRRGGRSRARPADEGSGRMTSSDVL
jgi:hypothetical protein